MAPIGHEPKPTEVSTKTIMQLCQAGYLAAEVRPRLVAATLNCVRRERLCHATQYGITANPPIDQLRSVSPSAHSINLTERSPHWTISASGSSASNTNRTVLFDTDERHGVLEQRSHPEAEIATTIHRPAGRPPSLLSIVDAGGPPIPTSPTTSGRNSSTS